MQFAYHFTPWVSPCTCAPSSWFPALFHDCKQVFCLFVTGEWYVVALPCLILRILMVAMYTCMQLHIHTCMQCIRMNVHTRTRGCTLYSILPCICYYIKPVMGDSILTCSAQKSLESASELILSVIIAGPVPVVHISPMAFNAELHTFLSLPNRISKADSKLAPYIPNCKCK